MTEIDLTPITRLEYDIDAILNDHAVAEPITRIELILADIVAGNTTTVVPVTRIETFLAIISGADYPVPEPVTRIETFLAIIAGENYETPEAVTRLEGLLAEWVEKGSGIWKTVSGSLIHITDALASPMQKCEVTLEPIQDLHGQDAPYPAGGGANIWDEVWEMGTIDPSTGTDLSSSSRWRSKNMIPIQPDTDYCYRWGLADGNKSTGRVCYYDVNGDYLSGNASFPGGGNSFANPAVFHTPANAYYMRFSPAAGTEYGNDTAINYPATVTSYSPYSNICPITGWTGCEVTRTGKNLCGGEMLKNNVLSAVTNATSDSVNKTVSFAGNETTIGYFTDGLIFKENTQYTAIFTYSKNSGGWSNIRIFYTDGNVQDVGSVSTTEQKETVVTVTYANKTVEKIGRTNQQGITTIYYDESGIFEGVLTADDFEAYSGTTLSVTFPSASMGKFEVVSGDLKPFKEYNPYNGETLVGEWMSDRDKYVAGTTPTIGAQVVDLGAFDTSVSLTPTPVDTLQGENNIWADCGDVEVTYKAQA